MSLLTDSKFIKLKKTDNLIGDFQGCAINSLMTLLHSIAPGHKITVDECKKIFDYDADGISNQKYRFNKFNNLLNEHKIPFKVYKSSFNSHQEVLKYLEFPVPIYFSMKVIPFIKDKFKYSRVTFNFGDEREFFESPNYHLLLLVGYDESGNRLYFIDPVYQLPYYSDKDLSSKEKFCSLDTKQFYECVRHIKSFIELKHMERLEKHYKSEKIKTEKQKKLN